MPTGPQRCGFANRVCLAVARTTKLKQSVTYSDDFALQRADVQFVRLLAGLLFAVKETLGHFDGPARASAQQSNARIDDVSSQTSRKVCCRISFRDRTCTEAA